MTRPKQPQSPFKPSRAIVLDPFDPDAEFRAKIYCHTNGATVWEGRQAR